MNNYSLLSDTLHILHIEDNPDDIYLIESLVSKIRETKIELCSVGSYETAKSIISQGAFDIALVDLYLPDSEGPQTVIKILELDQDIPIIVLTSLESIQTAIETVKLGAQDYLLKDCSVDVLTRSIYYAIERQKLINRIRNKSIQLEKFGYTIAHDLRNPLSTIRGLLDLIGLDLTQPNTTEQYLTLAKDTTDRVSDMIQHVWELSKKGISVKCRDSINLAALIDETINEGNLAINAIKIGQLQALPEIKGDAIRLKEVIQNLLNNAVRYQSTRPLQLQINAEQQNRHVVLSIADNGIGIDPADQEKVFDLFFQTDQSNTEGTGAGLAICKTLIEAHLGKIWVESDGKNGSTFYIKLPIDQH